jgi:hypothetical protein
MSLFATFRQRIADARRERRIRALRIAAFAAIEDNGITAASPLVHALFDECAKRSPQQLARLERMDPHARAVLEGRRSP